MVGVFPLLVMCDQRDIDGFYVTHHPAMETPVVFVYDRYQGGIGLAEKAFQSLEDILALAFETVEACGCDRGCPSCVQSGTCRYRNEMLDKDAAAVILGEILGRSNRTAVRQTIQPKAERRPRRERRLRRERRAEAWRPETPSRAVQRILREREQVRLREAMAQARREAMRQQYATKSKWQEGDRVWHLEYGAGTVLTSKIIGGSEIVTIKFDRRRGPVEINTSQHSLKAMTSGRRR